MRGLGFVAVVVLGIVGWCTFSTPESADIGGAPKIVPFSDAGEWVEELERGAEVEFRRQPVPDVGTSPESPPRAGFKSLGRLSAADEKRLHLRVDLAVAAHALAEARTAAESGDPEDYYKFLRERYIYAKSEAAARMIDEGSYCVLDSGAQTPIIPHDYGVMGYEFFQLENGELRNVWFLIPLDEYPAVKEALEAAEEFRSYRLDEVAAAFNVQPREVRMERIAANDSALRELRNWPENRPASEAAEIRKRLLPRDYTIHRDSWTISKRFRRNH